MKTIPITIKAVDYCDQVTVLKTLLPTHTTRLLFEIVKSKQN